MGSHTARRTAVLTGVLLALVAATADSAAARPDLVVTTATWTDYMGFDPEVGVVGRAGAAQVRIAERTRNAGSDFAGRSTTRYLLRRSDDRTTSLGLRRVEALEPGGSTRSVQDVFVTEAVAPGRYRVLACADGGRRVRERSERNNCRAARGTLLVRENSRPTAVIGAILGGAAGTGAIVEDTPAPLLGQMTVSDADDRFLSGATLGAIGAGGAGLYFASQSGITGTYNSGTGILTLTGRASVADYQTALRSVLIKVWDDDPPTSLKAEVRVRDAKGFWSRRARRTIPITPVNDPPRGDFSGPIDHAQLIARNVVLFDPDSALAGATVRIASGRASGDTLAFTNQRGIQGTYNSGTGVLTLTGNATVSDYQAALRTVTLTRSGAGRRTFEFQVTDTGGATTNWTREDGEVFD